MRRKPRRAALAGLGLAAVLAGGACDTDAPEDVPGTEGQEPEGEGENAPGENVPLDETHGAS